MDERSRTDLQSGALILRVEHQIVRGTDGADQGPNLMAFVRNCSPSLVAMGCPPLLSSQTDSPMPLGVLTGHPGGRLKSFDTFLRQSPPC
jgi:hypothetical protein